MKQTFKLFMVKEEPYLTIDENVVIGDSAIVTVNNRFPTLVECQNEEQIKLIQDPKLSMTKRHKIVMKPNEINLDENTINSFGEDESFITVEVEDGKIKVVNNNEEL
jgi:hypothetical protein